MKIETLLTQITQGVYIVGVTDGKKTHAFTAAWVMQVSFSPVLIAISINPKHHSYQLLKAKGVCSVNVLNKQQHDLAGHFGQSGNTNKMGVGDWQTGVTGAPILQESLVYFDCKVSSETAAGDHQLFICEVVDSGLLNKGYPMLYAETGNMDKSSDLYASRRISPRINVNLSAKVDVLETQQSFSMTLLNISHTGLGFSCGADERHKISPHSDFIDDSGKPIEIEIALNEFKLKGRIIYSRRLAANNYQIGVAFVAINNDEIEHLISCLKKTIK